MLYCEVVGFTQLLSISNDSWTEHDTKLLADLNTTACCRFTDVLPCQLAFRIDEDKLRSSYATMEDYS